MVNDWTKVNARLETRTKLEELAKYHNRSLGNMLEVIIEFAWADMQQNIKKQEQAK